MNPLSAFRGGNSEPILEAPCSPRPPLSPWLWITHQPTLATALLWSFYEKHTGSIVTKPTKPGFGGFGSTTLGGGVDNFGQGWQLSLMSADEALGGGGGWREQGCTDKSSQCGGSSRLVVVDQHQRWQWLMSVPG